MNNIVKLLLVTGFFWLTACSSSEAEDTQVIALTDIETIHIDHGSTTLHVLETDAEELEASLIMHDDGPGIAWDKRKDRLTISLNRDVTRLLNLGRMPELYVRIPAGYDGKLLVEGTSGQARIRDLHAGELEVKGKSGNIELTYPEINHPVKVTVSSGNVHMSLGSSGSDVNFMLESSSGRRSVAFPLEDHENTKRKTKGRIGDGSYPVHIKTSSGNITIEQHDG